jgi:hypothetical protein
MMVRFAMAAAVAGILLSACGEGDGARIDLASANPVYKGTQFETTFERLEAVSGEYLLFGGGVVPSNAQSVVPHAISFSVIPVPEAKAIASRYPDFHKCASPGAAEAKDRVVQLDIIPAGDGVDGELRAAYTLFQANLKSVDGVRTGVRLTGHRVKFVSAKHAETGTPMTLDRLPAQVRSHLEENTYLVVTGMEVIDAETALK